RPEHGMEEPRTGSKASNVPTSAYLWQRPQAVLSRSKPDRNRPSPPPRPAAAGTATALRWGKVRASRLANELAHQFYPYETPVNGIPGPGVLQVPPLARHTCREERTRGHP